MEKLFGTSVELVSEPETELNYIRRASWRFGGGAGDISQPKGLRTLRIARNALLNSAN
jgi:hypothetical protein